MNNFERKQLRGATKKANEVLDFVDDYIKYHGTHGCRIHLYQHHWDYVNNALVRNEELGVRLYDVTYRGMRLVPHK